MNGLMLNALKPPAQIFQEEGILFYPQIFRGEELERLRGACERVLEQFKQGDEQRDAICMRHLEDSRWHAINNEDLKLLLEVVADRRCLGPVEQIFEGESLFRCTSLFFNPQEGSKEGNWHRDLQFILPSEEEVKDSIATAPCGGVQFQIALEDTEDVEYVPFSATRYDSPEEYFVRCADDRVHNQQPMPNAIRVHQRPGDGIIFNANGLHRGRYHADKLRRTLMLTYTPRERPMHDHFSHHPWMLEQNYLDGVSTRARVYHEDFASVYRDDWMKNHEAADTK